MGVLGVKWMLSLWRWRYWYFCLFVLFYLFVLSQMDAIFVVIGIGVVLMSVVLAIFSCTTFTKEYAFEKRWSYRQYCSDLNVLRSGNIICYLSYMNWHWSNHDCPSGSELGVGDVVGWIECKPSGTLLMCIVHCDRLTLIMYRSIS